MAGAGYRVPPEVSDISRWNHLGTTLRFFFLTANIGFPTSSCWDWEYVEVVALVVGTKLYTAWVLGWTLDSRSPSYHFNVFFLGTCSHNSGTIGSRIGSMPWMSVPPLKLFALAQVGDSRLVLCQRPLKLYISVGMQLSSATAPKVDQEFLDSELELSYSMSIYPDPVWSLYDHMSLISVAGRRCSNYYL